jgi:hypothetical protein
MPYLIWVSAAKSTFFAPSRLVANSGKVGVFVLSAKKWDHGRMRAATSVVWKNETVESSRVPHSEIVPENTTNNAFRLRAILLTGLERNYGGILFPLF